MQAFGQVGEPGHPWGQNSLGATWKSDPVTAGLPKAAETCGQVSSRRRTLFSIWGQQAGARGPATHFAVSTPTGPSRQPVRWVVVLQHRWPQSHP